MHTKYLTSLLILSLVLNIVFAFLYMNTRNTRTTSTPDETNVMPMRAFEDGATVPFIRVVDGDTIIVGMEGRSEYVRLIGINSPEPNVTGEPECYAIKATDYAKQIFVAGTVQLYADPSQPPRDMYNRILAYVSLPDGTDAGEAMVRGGFAREFLYEAEYTRRGQYRQAEEEARNAYTGLWSTDICGE